MPTKKSRPNTHRQPHPRCNFQFADGRRCRMLRHPHLELCLFHNRELQQLQSAQEIGAELLALSGNFRSPIALNFVLGKLFGHVATGRMHRRQASTLAYIAQLLLQTLDTKRYDLARDWHDYAALIPTLDALYGPNGSTPFVGASNVGAGLETGTRQPQPPSATEPQSPVSSEASESDRESSSASTFRSSAAHDGKFPSTPATYLNSHTNAHQPPETTARL